MYNNYLANSIFYIIEDFLFSNNIGSYGEKVTSMFQLFLSETHNIAFLLEQNAYPV